MKKNKHSRGSAACIEDMGLLEKNGISKAEDLLIERKKIGSIEVRVRKRPSWYRTAFWAFFVDIAYLFLVVIPVFQFYNESLAAVLAILLTVPWRFVHIRYSNWHNTKR